MVKVQRMQGPPAYYEQLADEAMRSADECELESEAEWYKVRAQVNGSLAVAAAVEELTAILKERM